jgi:glycosyltransferase involved in cell wall biosynthesis
VTEPTGAQRAVPPSALHVNDCAFTAHNLVSRAQELGWPWSFQPVAAQGRTWPGLTGQIRKATLGARWLAVLAAKASRIDLLHVHSGSVLRHSRLVPKRYVLHLHGTDIRTLQYDPAWTSVIRGGVQHAEHVFYSTPDLAEHVQPLRPDASYLPVPVDVDRLPAWARATDRRPVVLFASRWDHSKGMDVQLQLARDLVRAVGDRADVVGLEWGSALDDARRAGVMLRPRVDHATFLGWLAQADVVVGQSAGILAASELEALAVGAPLVVPVPLPLYDIVTPPVLGGDVASAVDTVETLLDGAAHHVHDPVRGRSWVAEHHGVERAADAVADVYREIVRR